MGDDDEPTIWRVKTWWKPIPGEPVNEDGLVTTEQEFPEFERARIAALWMTCLRGTLGVVLYDPWGDVFGRYDRFSNVASGLGSRTKPNQTEGVQKPMNFEEVLPALLTERKRIARRSWAVAWLILVPGSSVTVEAGRPLGMAAPELIGRTVDYVPHIDLVTVDDAGVVVMRPWTCSQDNLMAADWFVVS